MVCVDCNKSRTYGTESSKVFDVVTCAIRILMKSNAVKGYYAADVVIAPETKRFKSTKTRGFEEMIDEGYKAAVDCMPDIMNVFKKGKSFFKKKFESEIEFR